MNRKGERGGQKPVKRDLAECHPGRRYSIEARFAGVPGTPPTSYNVRCVELPTTWSRGGHTG
jgi:hypothetical protein